MTDPIGRRDQKIAGYFEGDIATEYQARMIRECGRQQKSYPIDRIVTNPHFVSCHHRYCPVCQERRAAQWADTLKKVMDFQVARRLQNEQPPAQWLRITLEGIYVPVEELKNQLSVISELFTLAHRKSMWREGLQSSLRLLQITIRDQGKGARQVRPTHTIIANVSERLAVAHTKGQIEPCLKNDWLQPIGQPYRPRAWASQIQTETAANRDAVRNEVERLVNNWCPIPDKPTFFELAEQLRDTNTVEVTGELRKRIVFRPERIAQADDLRYEANYISSRLGEDLQLSLSGNRALPLIPWDLDEG